MSSNSPLTMPFLLRVRHVWIHGFLIGLILGGLGFGVYYFSGLLPSLSPSAENENPALRKTLTVQMPPGVPAVSEPMQLKEPLVVPQVVSQAPTHPDRTIEQELAHIFSKIKAATLNKDLPGLIDLYSPHFPGLAKKKSNITNSWKLYEYKKMDFKVQEIKKLADNSLVAWVTWDVTVKNLATSKIKNISKTFRISFIKESGQWHIMDLKNAFW